MSMAITYSDGASVESQILQLLAQSNDLGSHVNIASQHYDQWPIRYHLCVERSNLLRHLQFQGLEVLELGAGMGGVSRYLAEQSQSLTVVEGTQVRFNAIASRLRNLKNWRGIVENIHHLQQGRQLSQLFDVVCIIGVLEYSELFIEDQIRSDIRFNPAPLKILQIARNFLKSEGVVIVAIENKLGLKYWSGAAEDHSGRIFDGITGYPLAKSPKTFSRSELKLLLQMAGFSSIQEFYPYPDYKVPSFVASAELLKTHPGFVVQLASREIFESYGSKRVRYFSDDLAMKNLVGSGLLAEFANSFLFCGAATPDSNTLRHLTAPQERGEQGWFYTIDKYFFSETTVTKDSGASPTQISCQSKLKELGPCITGIKKVRWLEFTQRPILLGEDLKSELLNYLYFEQWDLFLKTLSDFLKGSVEKWQESSLTNHLQGKALDSLWVNAIRVGKLWDHPFSRWELLEPMSKSWFILRNVESFISFVYLFNSDFLRPNFMRLYESLCQSLEVAPNFDADILLESSFIQWVGLLVSGISSYNEEAQNVLRAQFLEPFPQNRVLPRYPMTNLQNGLAQNALRVPLTQSKANPLPVDWRWRKVAGISKRIFKSLGKF